MFPSSGKIIGSNIGEGLFVIKIGSSVTGIAGHESIPDKYSLKQNYPNPFNPGTTIEYNVPKSSYVTLKVFDVVGRQVALLADEFKIAGTYKQTFDAARLASGVYY